jgi:hypothetical protein
MILTILGYKKLCEINHRAFLLKCVTSIGRWECSSRSPDDSYCAATSWPSFIKVAGTTATTKHTAY